ncbi:MAG: phosphoribosylglycinamide synthetase C domain-containing protein, partial [candidate division WOR-3 bacterium]
VDGRLAGAQLECSSRWALCVVAAASGYPGPYRKGLELTGDLEGTEDAIVFHAGTRLVGGRTVTSGGRVLGITGLGSSLAEARDRAYAAVAKVRFDGMFFRRDIGVRGLARLAGSG